MPIAFPLTIIVLGHDPEIRRAIGHLEAGNARKRGTFCVVQAGKNLGVEVDDAVELGLGNVEADVVNWHVTIEGVE